MNSTSIELNIWCLSLVTFCLVCEICDYKNQDCNFFGQKSKKLRSLIFETLYLRHQAIFCKTETPFASSMVYEYALKFSIEYLEPFLRIYVPNSKIQKIRIFPQKCHISEDMKIWLKNMYYLVELPQIHNENVLKHW